MSPARPEPLFDPTSTLAKRCTARDCEAGTRRNLCPFDYARGQGDIGGKRPRGCLNSAQNRDGIPY